MDWRNIDLKDNYERGQNILDPYNFDILLLEINCNLKEINKKTIEAHFNDVLENKISCAKEVFKNNLDNLTKYAVNYRNIK